MEVSLAVTSVSPSSKTSRKRFWTKNETKIKLVEKRERREMFVDAVNPAFPITSMRPVLRKEKLGGLYHAIGYLSMYLISIFFFFFVGMKALFKSLSKSPKATYVFLFSSHVSSSSHFFSNFFYL
jgi:hypothetical protein